MTIEPDLRVEPRSPNAKEYWLKHDVRTKGNWVNFTIPLMPIYEHERDLDRGRFERFLREEQEHVARIRIGQREEPVPPVSRFIEWVNWIAEYNDQPWSVRLEMDNVHQGTFYFSFSDLSVGTMFKLIYG